jgi:glyoxylase-like metal-dependent hydrolase (beta-lactamase superfamily II)
LHTREIGESLFLTDLEPGGFKGVIASYVLKGKKSVIIETGPTSSVNNLLLGLAEIDVKPADVSYVALSHVHIDHGGGAGTLLKFLPNAKVIVHPKGVAHLVDPRRLWQDSKKILGDIAEIYGSPEPVAENRIIAAHDNMILNVEKDLELRVTETLGHASHHLSFYSSSHRGVFPGDAAGIYTRECDITIPTSPPPFRLDASLTSLEKLISLKPEFLFYTHFGKADEAIDRLRNYSEQISLWAKIAQEGVKNRKRIDEITEKILEEDEKVGRIVSLLSTNPLLMKAGIRNSVQGLIDSAEKSNL